jgi:hypothetical protein
MQPNQRFWSGTRTHGGWFVTKRSLPRELGLPAQPPASGGSHVWRWSGVGAGVVLLAAAVALLRSRVRPRARPVSA